MQLTTLTRIKRLLPVNTSTQHDGLLTSLLATASAQIERHLNRHVLRTARTEQYLAEPLQRRIFLKGAPVVASPALQLRYSPSRDFTIDAVDTSIYYVNLAEGIIEYDLPAIYTAPDRPGAFQVIATSGLAASLQSLSAAITPGTPSLSAAEVATGGTSGASGTVSSITATAIVLAVTNGAFEEGETITGGTSAGTAVLGTFSATPLCIAYPEVVEACNLQTSWLFQRKDNLGMSSVSSEGYTISLEKSATLLKGVVEMLEPLRRMEVSP